MVNLSCEQPTPSGRSGANLRCFEKISRYDVVLDGVKIAGGAQRVTKTGLLHQGSIQTSHEKILPSELMKAWEIFGSQFLSLSLTNQEIEKISSLAHTKYNTPQWSRSSSLNSLGLIPNETTHRIACLEPQPVS